MLNHASRVTVAFLGVALVVVAFGCSRRKPAPATAPSANHGAQPVTAVAQAAKAKAAKIAATQPTTGNVTSTPSEHVASGKPIAPPEKYRSVDAKSGGVYYGNPQMQLDSKTLQDVKNTIEQTCALLEEGVDLLETYAKTPEKAAKALDKYRDKNADRIQRVFKSASDIKARLRSAGYDQDIPAEVRPDFEKRMGAIQERLEKMRTTYREHTDVLEAFGRLFPRGP